MRTVEDNWNEASDRALAGGKGKAAAWYQAKIWCYFFENKKSAWFTKLLSEVGRVLSGNVFKSAHTTMVHHIFEAIRTGNADFFRQFANALESKAATYCPVRKWLVKKHRADDDGNFPRFTHKELLKDADKCGINLDERQLRRLMSELHFRFRNSR